jgi:hypothetical protein
MIAGATRVPFFRFRAFALPLAGFTRSTPSEYRTKSASPEVTHPASQQQDWQMRVVSANTIERDSIGLHRPPVGTFVPGIVSRGGSVVGGRANCDGGGRRLVGSIVGSTGVKNASPWADLPPKAMSPFAVDTRSPGRNVGSFFTPSGARPKGSLPLQVQFATSSLR